MKGPINYFVSVRYERIHGMKGARDAARNKKAIQFNNNRLCSCCTVTRRSFLKERNKNNSYTVSKKTEKVGGA